MIHFYRPDVMALAGGDMLVRGGGDCCGHVGGLKTVMEWCQ